jgi:hypothetical protein
VQRALEQKYKENPFHPLHRRNVLRVLRAKYAPLFLAQDMSARRIQISARRYLYYARIRWALNDQRAKFLQQLVHDFAFLESVLYFTARCITLNHLSPSFC